MHIKKHIFIMSTKSSGWETLSDLEIKASAANQ